MSVGAPSPYISGMAVRQRISRAQPKGLPIINMGFNELPYAPPDSVLDTIRNLAPQANRYGSGACIQLREALAQRHGLDVERLICGNGSEELLDVIARCFVRPGDEILISEFGYIQFSIIAHRLGAKLVKAPEVGFTAEVDEMLSRVGEKTKLIFLANPNNPTGTMLPVGELQRLAQSLPGHVVLVLDLAYGEFVGADYCSSVHQLADRYENVLVTRTFSKIYGLAGLRVGWCHAPAAMMGPLSAARGMGSVNAFAQAAGLAVLKEQAQIDLQVAKVVAERDRMVTGLSRLGLKLAESHTNFIMCEVPGEGGEGVDGLTGHLFDEAGIVVGPVREPGLANFIRFSVSLPEHNDLLVATVSDFVQSMT